MLAQGTGYKITVSDAKGASFLVGPYNVTSGGKPLPSITARILRSDGFLGSTSCFLQNTNSTEGAGNGSGSIAPDVAGPIIAVLVVLGIFGLFTRERRVAVVVRRWR